MQEPETQNKWSHAVYCVFRKRYQKHATRTQCEGFGNSSLSN